MPPGACSLLWEDSVANVNSVALLAWGGGAHLLAGVHAVPMLQPHAGAACRLAVLLPNCHYGHTALHLQASPSPPAPMSRCPATASIWGRPCWVHTTSLATGAQTACGQTTAGRLRGKAVCLYGCGLRASRSTSAILAASSSRTAPPMCPLLQDCGYPGAGGGALHAPPQLQVRAGASG